MKLTKKYFKDKINSSYSEACSVLMEVVKRYGEKVSPRGSREFKLRCDFNWNHKITGISIYKKKLWVDYYWQGDHTDGNNSAEFDSSGVYIPGELEDVGYTRYRCGDIRISKDEIYDAIKKLAESL